MRFRGPRGRGRGRGSIFRTVGNGMSCDSWNIFSPPSRKIFTEKEAMRNVMEDRVKMFIHTLTARMNTEIEANTLQDSAVGFPVMFLSPTFQK